MSEEKARIGIYHRHEMEYKKDVERLQEKAAKYEDETTQAQFSLESIFRESKEKVFSFKLIIFYSKLFL